MSSYVCVSVCMRERELLIQGFGSHSLEVVNNIVLKAFALGYDSISLYMHKTLADLTLLVGCFRIFDIVRHFHFSFYGILSQLPWFAVL